MSLALQDEPGLNKADPTLCASQRTTHHLRNLPWWRDLQLDPISKKESMIYIVAGGG